MEPRISAVLITLNEEANLTRCLDSLWFCDEIIVVDANSVDRTREIASAYTQKVFVREWKGYVGQRTEALSFARNEWVLSIDADEVVANDLREEILSVLKRPESETVSAFSMPRRTIHLGRWIKHGGWYPDRLIRLFRKSEGHWVGNEIHESWQTEGTVLPLTHDLYHYSFADLSDQVKRNNRYSSLGAVALQRDGYHFSGIRLFLKSASKFIETYLVKRGFLDGYPGFIISVSAAYSVFLKWAKLWELEAGEKNSAT